MNIFNTLTISIIISGSIFCPNSNHSVYSLGSNSTEAANGWEVVNNTPKAAQAYAQGASSTSDRRQRNNHIHQIDIQKLRSDINSMHSAYSYINFNTGDPALNVSINDKPGFTSQTEEQDYRDADAVISVLRRSLVSSASSRYTSITTTEEERRACLIPYDKDAFNQEKAKQLSSNLKAFVAGLNDGFFKIDFEDFFNIAASESMNQNWNNAASSLKKTIDDMEHLNLKLNKYPILNDHKKEAVHIKLFCNYYNGLSILKCFLKILLEICSTYKNDQNTYDTFANEVLKLVAIKKEKKKFEALDGFFREAFGPSKVNDCSEIQGLITKNKISWQQMINEAAAHQKTRDELLQAARNIEDLKKSLSENERKLQNIQANQKSEAVLKSQIQELQREQKGLQQKSFEIQEKQDALENLKQKAEDAIEQAKNDQTALQRHVSQQEREIEQNNQRLNDLKNQEQTLNQNKANLEQKQAAEQQKVELINAQIDKLKNNMQTNLIDREKAQQDIKKLEKELLEHGQNIANLQNLKTNLATEAEQLMQNFNQIQHQAQQAQRAQEDAAKKIAIAEREHEAVAGAMMARQKEAEGLMNNLSEIAKEKEQIKASFKQKQTDLNNIEAAIKESDKQKDAIIAMKKNAQDEIAKASEDLKNINDEIENLKDQLKAEPPKETPLKKVKEAYIPKPYEGERPIEPELKTLDPFKFEKKEFNETFELEEPQELQEDEFIEEAFVEDGEPMPDIPNFFEPPKDDEPEKFPEIPRYQVSKPNYQTTTSTYQPVLNSFQRPFVIKQNPFGVNYRDQGQLKFEKKEFKEKFKLKEPEAFKEEKFIADPQTTKQQTAPTKSEPPRYQVSQPNYQPIKLSYQPVLNSSQRPFGIGQNPFGRNYWDR